jgi:hypothetical protein
MVSLRKVAGIWQKLAGKIYKYAIWVLLFLSLVDNPITEKGFAIMKEMSNEYGRCCILCDNDFKV